ncbi:Sec-independent protein translocase protein TatB [Parendozoicomonas haliclonae]|uniref:Sec-independent protein translocase protein TatB n=1 Tax=Parendozoicomonas haliclonae TaxID=1960125 RepID=A0A1X7AEW9_9GAMM|nr:Sec-independent protein translocase protein TatB [Parendozoicomonas haliclonae]SMA35853.1 Sec-independent protein translocase protein TatB [Parendozoicomonas haliclonae]
MFDIGFLELVIIAVIALVVLGPERLPVAIKTTALWVSRIKRSFQGIRSEIERELKVDEIRREIHNNNVMDELKRTREEISQEVSAMRKQVDLTDDLKGVTAEKSSSAPEAPKADAQPPKDPSSQS